MALVSPVTAWDFEIDGRGSCQRACFIKGDLKMNVKGGGFDALTFGRSKRQAKVELEKL
jgi:hypothetical protein